MRQTVIGFFNSKSDAQEASERLKANGFSDSDIDITSSHADEHTSGQNYTSGQTNQESYVIGDQSTASYSNDGTTETSPYDVNDESMESRTSSNRLNEDRIRDRQQDDNDEGFGDSIGRFFRNLFDNKDEAEKYSSVGRKSSILTVYVDSSEEAMKAADILDTCGAVDVDERAREMGSYTDTTRDTSASADLSSTDYSSRSNINADGVTDQSIPIIEEDVHIGKRQVETGGVRLRSRIIERPVEESLRLREEHIRVERNAVNRPATEADFNTFREGEIEMTETSEVPIVNKEARVVEEVRLNKEVTERDEVVRDTVRKTDVDVENLNEETLKSRKGGRKKL